VEQLLEAEQMALTLAQYSGKLKEMGESL